MDIEINRETEQSLSVRNERGGEKAQRKAWRRRRGSRSKVGFATDDVDASLTVRTWNSPPGKEASQ